MLPKVVITSDPLKQEHLMIKGGSISKLSAGFGSSYDMEEFYIAICDNCIKTSLDTNRIESISDIEQKVKGKNLFK